MGEQIIKLMQGVTVVVPTLNRQGFLLNCLRDLIAQTHRPLEILVVDQSEVMMPEVELFVNDYRDLVSYHRVRFKGLPNARNYGWQVAKFDIIIYVDDDIRCSPDFVEQHLKAIQMPKVGVVGGGVDTIKQVQDKGPIGRFNYWTGTATRGWNAKVVCEVDHILGCNFSVWRHIAKEVGGFDEAMNVGAALQEETEFCLRVKKAGYKIIFNGQARLLHLAGQNGGCRIKDVYHYDYALSHNRGIIIRRHLRWYHRPVAVIYLFTRALWRCFRYHALKPFTFHLHGFYRGYARGAKLPECTIHCFKSNFNSKMP